MKDGEEEENKKEERERAIIDAFYSEGPAAGLESLFCFLCLSLVPFSLLSSSYFSSVTLLLSHLVVFTLPRVYTLTYSSFQAFLL